MWKRRNPRLYRTPAGAGTRREGKAPRRAVRRGEGAAGGSVFARGGAVTTDEIAAGVADAGGDAGTQLRIMFFRGPGGERFEVLQDNIKPL